MNSSEAGSALGRPVDFLQRFAQAPFSGHTLRQELAIALNAAEDGVEVVGDASGEAADGLHLLHLA